MKNIELKPSKIYQLSYLIDYQVGAAVSKPIIEKDTGSVSISSFDKGELLSAKASPFDMLIQIVEGVAEVMIGEKSVQVKSGQIMIIPAHNTYEFKANERFKLVSTTIKSGYEEVSIL